MKGARFFYLFYLENFVLITDPVDPQMIRSNAGAHSIVENTGGWLDSLGSGISAGKIYFGVLQKN